MTIKHKNNERPAPHSSRLTAVATLVVASTLLASCATPGGAAGGDDCNPLIGALVGGAVGALMGGDRHRGRGAAIGAGVGALTCVAYNYSSKQTRTADQVGDEYRRARGDLPPAPVVTGYRTQVARTTARAGEDVTVTSNIEVVPGRTEPLKELREEFVILDPKGVERSKLEKTPAPAGSRVAPMCRRCSSPFRRVSRPARTGCSRNSSSTAKWRRVRASTSRSRTYLRPADLCWPWPRRHRAEGTRCCSRCASLPARKKMPGDP